MLSSRYTQRIDGIEAYRLKLWIAGSKRRAAISIVPVNAHPHANAQVGYFFALSKVLESTKRRPEKDS